MSTRKDNWWKIQKIGFSKHNKSLISCCYDKDKLLICLDYRVTFQGSNNQTNGENKDA